MASNLYYVHVFLDCSIHIFWREKQVKVVKCLWVFADKHLQKLWNTSDLCILQDVYFLN